MVMNSISGTAEHLSSEILAAFLDKQLSDEENAEVRQHLAQCEECYQVFTEAVDFLEEEAAGVDADLPLAAVLPFAESPKRQLPPPAPRRALWRGRWAAAATVILALGLGYGGFRSWQGPEEVSTDGLTREALAEPSMRGPGQRSSSWQEQFDAGKAAVLLRVEVRERNAEGARLALLKLAGLLGVELSLPPQSPPEKILATAREFLRSESVLYPEWFELGQWVAANRAAARSGQDRYFRGLQGWENRRYLERLLDRDAELLGETASNLRQVQNLLEKGASQELVTALEDIAPPPETEEGEAIP